MHTKCTYIHVVYMAQTQHMLLSLPNSYANMNIQAMNMLFKYKARGNILIFLKFSFNALINLVSN